MPVPARLDRYREIRVLGSGGMGVVSLAEDTTLGRQVALKRVTAAAGAGGTLRLRREALVGASINHDNLVAIYDVDEYEDGNLVIVMEYVEGQTLRDALAQQESGLGPEETLRILSRAAAGLDAIHRQGVVHRDVKPANVLLGAQGDVKIADLGIAAVADRTRITTSGAIMGSLAYMAPEQLNDEAATSAIDVYALAAVAYETLSGRRARRQPNPAALAYAIETKPPPDLRDDWPQAPRAAAELLMRGMDHDPARRPRSAGELVDELSTALRSPARPRVSHRPPERPAPAAPRAPATVAAAAPAPPTAPPTAPRPVGRRRRSRLLPAALLGLAGVAVIGAVLLASNASSPTRSHASARAPSTPQAKGHTSGAGATAAAHGSSSSSSSPASAAATSAPTTTTAAAAPAGGPGAAATSFYTLAAGHHFAQAWALADPAFRSQLGGYQSFENTFAADLRITVGSVRTLNRSTSGATIALTSTSVRSDGTQHCTATVQLVPGGAVGGWLMHHIQVSCR